MARRDLLCVQNDQDVTVYSTVGGSAGLLLRDVQYFARL